MTPEGEAPSPVSLVDTTFSVETPEQIEIVHEAAGIGSRFAAGSIDFFCILLPACLGMCAVSAALPRQGTTEEEALALGFASAGVFQATTWIYYLASETLTGGRTIGKRLLRLRVTDRDGGPARTGALVVRNVLRVFDALPLVHFIAGIVMFADARSRRLGDLAAGTVVVRERPESATASVRGPGLTDGEAALVASFLGRRAELAPAARWELAERIAGRIRARTGIAPPPSGPDAETLLVLLANGRTPEELLAAMAPVAPDAPLPPEPPRSPEPPPPLPPAEAAP